MNEVVRFYLTTPVEGGDYIHLVLEYDVDGWESIEEMEADFQSRALELAVPGATVRHELRISY